MADSANRKHTLSPEQMLKGMSAKEARQLLRSLSAKELRQLLSMAEAQAKKSPAKADTAPRWFDQKICGQTKDGRKRLIEMKKLLANPITAPQADTQWIRYAEAFKAMPFKVPAFYRKAIDARKLFNRLQRFCQKHDLPDEIISSVLPELIQYIRTGRMRPIIFVGERGSGKTTAVRLITQEALGIPVEIIKAPDVHRGHGLTGDSGIYKSSDLGYFARAQIRNNSRIVGYLIDEIDKACRGISGSSIDEELLSVTDESVDSIEDKYLASTIVSLPYCPIFMTGNDLSQINPILADRCKVIRYPNATPERIKAIMHKFVDKKLAEDTFNMIDFNLDMLNSSIDTLVKHNVSSLRKHQQLIELVLDDAFTAAMTSGADRIAVTAAMFAGAEEKIIGVSSRKVGF